MNITFEAASTDHHFEQILQLQKKNLFSTISEAEQATQGFVFVEHTAPLLKTMATYLPQMIALNDNQVVGYVLAMHPAMKNDIPSLKPMFAEFEQTHYQGKILTEYTFMVGGQTCIDTQFRGKGQLKHLYHESRSQLSPEYELWATEIATRNTISIKAHEKIGFEVVHTYHDGKEEWNIVVWDLRR